jgi:hypothetical protein
LLAVALALLVVALIVIAVTRHDVDVWRWEGCRNGEDGRWKSREMSDERKG